MVGASWTDWLVVGEKYGQLGRHREAIEIFRQIMPHLAAALPGGIVREAGHFRAVARSFAAVGDVATAAALLRAEGKTPEPEIPRVLERLRATAKRQP